MSYCRWSSDFGECDVYVYEDASGGWTTHVAGRRFKHLVPDSIKAMMPSYKDPHFTEKYMELRMAEEKWRNSFPHTVHKAQDTEGKETSFTIPADSEYEWLPSPEAGESYNDPTPEACADRLEALRAKGFRVPQRAIDRLRNEKPEEDK